MRHPAIIAATLGLLPALAAPASPPPVSPAAIRAHDEFLADDLLEGLPLGDGRLGQLLHHLQIQS